MTTEQLESWADRLTKQLVSDTPEGIVRGMAQLVLMKDQFKAPLLYFSLLKTMAGTLILKCAKEGVQ